MRLTLTGKIIALLLFTVALLTLATFLTVRSSLTAGLNRMSLEEIQTKADAVESMLRDAAHEVKGVTFLLSSRPDVAEAIKARDTAKLVAIAKAAQQELRITFVTIADANGQVVARGHSDKVGDSISNQINVQRALAGQATVGLEEGTAVKFSLRSGQPVTEGGKVIGSITAGIDLSSSNDYVDNIKKKFGVDCTIFFGDTRVATTILRDGKRIIGTKLDDPAIVETVLTKGSRFLGINTVAGRSYYTAYWPLVGANGKISGMIFIGRDRDAILGTERSILLSTLGASCLAALVILVLGFFTARGITSPLRQIIGLARKVSAGDLEARAEGRFTGEMAELKGALASMMEALKAKIAEAEAMSREAGEKASCADTARQEAESAQHQAETAKREGMLEVAENLGYVVESIIGASGELESQVDLVRQGSDQQRDRLREVVEAITQMTATVLDVAKNAARAAQSAGDTKTRASDGASVVEEAMHSIDRVNAVSRELKTAMNALGEQTQAIGRVMSVISDIADQTNLLALNAAIEAARAGEAGRGFAVVADEVRKLAEKTMSATAEVGQSIRGIQEGTRKSATGVHEAVTVIEDATGLAEQSGQALDAIVSLVETASDQVRSIAAASEQQSAASEAIEGSIVAVNEVSQETAQAMKVSEAVRLALRGRVTAYSA